MLRAQAVGSLFTLVPILLFMVVSIVLRTRASRKRKQREQAERGAPLQQIERPIPRERSAETTRSVSFPRQRETSEVHHRRSVRAPSSTAPRLPQQPRAAQVIRGEIHAYPPPLVPSEDTVSAAGEDRPGSPAIPRAVLRPSVESRMAVAGMAAPKKAKTLRERMADRGMADRSGAGAAAGSRSSITTRLERLPPLKRAVVWAEILGPPGGGQQKSRLSPATLLD